jgi:hypothetical protein
MTAFASGLMVAGRADPARLVPAITLTLDPTAWPEPSARKRAAIEIAKRLQAIHHYREIKQCA